MIARLLKDGDARHRYIVKKKLQPELREVLRNNYGIWQGSLFSDSAGAAEAVSRIVFSA
jgi:hypothetical protein